MRFLLYRAPTLSRHDRPLLGIMFVVIASLCVSSMDMMAKYLSPLYAVYLLVWARFAVHFVISFMIVLLRHGVAGFLHAPQLGWQLLRGCGLLSGSLCFYLALQTLTLADTLALVFTSPLVVTVLAPWMLNEKVGWRRWMAVLIGFFGACLIIRPGFQVFHYGLLAGLGSGFSFGFYLVLTRRLSPITPVPIALFYSSVPAMIVLTPLGLPLIPMEFDLNVLMIIMLGFTAMIAHLLITLGYGFAAAAMLAPFSYLELPIATLGAYFIFHEVPSYTSWFGIIILASAGLYISWREGVKAATGQPSTG